MEPQLNPLPAPQCGAEPSPIENRKSGESLCVVRGDYGAVIAPVTQAVPIQVDRPLVGKIPSRSLPTP